MLLVLDLKLTEEFEWGTFWKSPNRYLEVNLTKSEEKEKNSKMETNNWEPNSTENSKESSNNSLKQVTLQPLISKVVKQILETIRDSDLSDQFKRCTLIKEIEFLQGIEIPREVKEFVFNSEVMRSVRRFGHNRIQPLVELCERNILESLRFQRRNSIELLLPDDRLRESLFFQRNWKNAT